MFTKVFGFYIAYVIASCLTILGGSPFFTVPSKLTPELSRKLFIAKEDNYGLLFRPNIGISLEVHRQYFNSRAPSSSTKWDICVPFLLKLSDGFSKVEIDLVEHSMQSQKNPLHSEIIYKILKANPDYVKEFIKRNFFRSRLVNSKLVFKAWSETELENLRKLVGDQDFSLFVDPGIMSRRERFLKFRYHYREKNSNSNALALRNAFSDELGMITMYRGLSGHTNLDQAKKILNDGMGPNFEIDPDVSMRFHQPISKEENFRMFWTQDGPLGEILRKSTTASLSLIMPVTSFKELAKRFATPKWEATGYLFTLRVPVLEVYDYTMSNSLGWDFKHLYKTRPILWEGQYPSPELENFMFAFIPAEYIEGFSETIQGKYGTQPYKGLEIFK